MIDRLTHPPFVKRASVSVWNQRLPRTHISHLSVTRTSSGLLRNMHGRRWAFDDVRLERIPAHRWQGIKLLCKFALECPIGGRCCVQCSAAEQHLQAAADTRLTRGNFQSQWNMWEWVVAEYSSESFQCFSAVKWGIAVFTETKGTEPIYATIKIPSLSDFQ